MWRLLLKFQVELHGEDFTNLLKRRVEVELGLLLSLLFEGGGPIQLLDAGAGENLVGLEAFEIRLILIHGSAGCIADGLEELAPGVISASC